METTIILKQLGLSDKEIKVYLKLLAAGPVSVRTLATLAGINRGTTYDILKSLQKLGLVSYYHKATKQYFLAEDPSKLLAATEEKIRSLNEIKESIKELIPELKSLQASSKSKPVVKYYESYQGVKTILTDVLETVAQAAEKQYYVFSSSSLRPYLYKAFPRFTSQRIKKGIKVEAVAVGSGGEEAKLSARKWLTQKEGSPTYILIYAGKVAMISVNQNKEPLGLIIEDQALYQTQLQLFQFIWQAL